ncbi:hypothetical protein [Planctomicrobium piriforme]|uniref:Uncharacterized protein n=1 Tax=Planctomicrobium piriforme TaxID=1576369 RepID=A0A1I3B8K7_9PLAN|nr:hypothetical protein [Planctomicrobium piriforme]SFH58643.1 hypothetical protein SAMN05421753_101304 [Planctomicrobium piriforme]
MNLDDLKPLKWNHFNGPPGMQVWIASTPVGQYMVKQFHEQFRWDCSFYSEARTKECESREAGMHAAWEHWKNVVRQIIEPHPMDGTIVRASTDS